MPTVWVGKAVRRGVAADVSCDLLHWLVEKDFADREVEAEPERVKKFIDDVYAEAKARYDQDPYSFKLSNKEFS
jgi:hypothetical protein